MLYAEPDWKVHAARLTDDTLLPDLWHLPAVRGPEAWNTTTGSPEVKVCVLDSGIDVGHPDLAANVVGGWNFVPVEQEDPDGPPAEYGTPQYLNLQDGTSISHGTHVAGVIAAVGNNTRGVVGLAFNVSWLAAARGRAGGGLQLGHAGVGRRAATRRHSASHPRCALPAKPHLPARGWLTSPGPCAPSPPQVKLLICRFLWDNEDGNMSDAASCMELCRVAGALIVVGAWGGVMGPVDKDLSLLAKAYEAAAAEGQLIVMAAGNGGYDMDTEPVYPASFMVDNMVNVGGTDSYGSVDRTSNYGRDVHLTAPGKNIVSTIRGGDYGPLSGTSMATPIVAAAAALLQSAALEAGEAALSYQELKAALLAGADPPGEWDVGKSSHGKLNVAASLRAVVARLKSHPRTHFVTVGERSCGTPGACNATAACNRYQTINAITTPNFGLIAKKCNASTSYRVVAGACLGRRSCSVPVRRGLFGGEPCPGVVSNVLNFKYT